MPPRLLVVDDEAALRGVLVEVLRDEGYFVQEAPDGADALRIVDATTINLVLSDVRMPGMSGFHLAEELRRRSPATSIILMSCDRRVPSGDLTPFLDKPFELDALIALVAHTLKGAA